MYIAIKISSLVVAQGTFEEQLDRLGGQRLQPEDADPRAERRDQIEIGILAGQPDQEGQTVLDGRQQDFLLGAAPLVGLVEHQGRPAALGTAAAGGSEDAA